MVMAPWLEYPFHLCLPNTHEGFLHIFHPNLSLKKCEQQSKDAIVISRTTWSCARACIKCHAQKRYVFSSTPVSADIIASLQKYSKNSRDQIKWIGFPPWSKLLESIFQVLAQAETETMSKAQNRRSAVKELGPSARPKIWEPKEEKICPVSSMFKWRERYLSQTKFSDIDINSLSNTIFYLCLDLI